MLFFERLQRAEPKVIFVILLHFFFGSFIVVLILLTVNSCSLLFLFTRTLTTYNFTTSLLHSYSQQQAVWHDQYSNFGFARMLAGETAIFDTVIIKEDGENQVEEFTHKRCQTRYICESFFRQKDNFYLPNIE